MLLGQTFLSLVSLVSFAHVFDVGDLVVAQVECVEVQHEIQSFDLSNTVVAEVQLFEVFAGGGEQLRRERKRGRGEGEGAGRRRGEREAENHKLVYEFKFMIPFALYVCLSLYIFTLFSLPLSRFSFPLLSPSPLSLLPLPVVP